MIPYSSRECSPDLIKALNILQATPSIHPSTWRKDCKLPETHPATSWISWLGKRQEKKKMNSHLILPFPHEPELCCCSWDVLTGDVAVQEQNPGCRDPIVSLALQMLFLQQNPIFWSPLDAPKRIQNTSKALLHYRSYFRHRRLLRWGHPEPAQGKHAYFFLNKIKGKQKILEDSMVKLQKAFF